MKKYLDTFNEFMFKQKLRDVIISYDCSQKHSDFAAKLLKLIREQYDGVEITLSNYKLGNQLTFEQIDALKDEILALFNNQQLNENRAEKRTIVVLITPNENQFIVDEIINESLTND